MSKLYVLTLALMTGLGINTVAIAQYSAQPQPAATQNAQKPLSTDHRVLRPGDRNCVRYTGSLIPAKPGECLPVAGRSYSGDELRRTGTLDNARALQMLDPSISTGH
jgi:hypothetical protein